MELKFRLQGLLYKGKDGKITGAMSPVLFIKEMEQQAGFNANGLVRVWFDDNEYNNWYEGGDKEKYLTGCDTVIALQKYRDGETLLMMFVDNGTSGTPVAMKFSKDNDIVITEIYGKKHYERKLTTEQVREIFKTALEGNYFDIK